MKMSLYFIYIYKYIYIYVSTCIYICTHVHIYAHISIYPLCIYVWRRQWHHTPVLLPGKSHGRRSLVGYSPWGHEEWDTTERLHFHFSLSCIGEGNGNPLQCSCLENPRDGGAWWAAIYGVAQSRTWLQRLTSSSNNAGEHNTAFYPSTVIPLYPWGIGFRSPLDTRLCWMLKSLI